MHVSVLCLQSLCWGSRGQAGSGPGVLRAETLGSAGGRGGTQEKQPPGSQTAGK